jgi:hypothetical protein
MLPGITPALFGGGFLAPSQAFGNDSCTVSLLHFDAPDGQVGVANTGMTDSAYGAPARRNAWTTGAGSFSSTTGLCNQVAFFNGSAMIQCPDAPDLDFGSGDFTIDFWWAPNILASGVDVVAKRTNSGTSDGPFLIYQNGATLYFFCSSAAGGWDIASAQVITAGQAVNQWGHVAVTRQGSTFRTFFNGVPGATWSSSLAVAKLAQPVRIGGVSGGPFLTGWMEEFRISRGIARWTAPFTPPNQPYYAQLNGGNDAATKLLLHFDMNAFTLDSSNGSMRRKSVINNGAGQLGSPTSAALTSNVAQVTSGTQRITVASSTELNNIRANFTIDFMYYRTTNSGGILFSRRNNNSQFCPIILTDAGGGTLHLYMSTNGSTWTVDANCATGLALTTWYHLALVRNRNLLTFYVNGVQTFQQDVALTTFQTSAYDLQIGADTNGSGNNALFEEFRYSDVARWTAPFTAPAPGGAPYGPDPVLDVNTKLLMHFDSTTTVTDSSPYAHGTATTIGTGVGSTGAQIKFGNGSCVFPGGTNCLQYADNPDWNFGANDFTVEAWMFPTALATDSTIVMHLPTVADFQNAWKFVVRATDKIIRFVHSQGGTNIIQLQSVNPAVLNVWTHIAAVRSGNNLALYINGVAEATGTFSGALPALTGPLNIGVGDAGAGSAYFTGYIDELRISNVARWTANFTPPTAPYT